MIIINWGGILCWQTLLTTPIFVCLQPLTMFLLFHSWFWIVYQKKAIESLKGPHSSQTTCSHHLSFPLATNLVLGKLPPTKPSHKEHGTKLDMIYSIFEWYTTRSVVKDRHLIYMLYDGIGVCAWYGPFGGSNVRNIASLRERERERWFWHPTTFAS